MNNSRRSVLRVKALLLKELRELAASRSFWVMLLVLCPFVGFSFIEATFLYAHAGESILGDEILLGRLSTLEGIVVPTFSALYLSETFLFPFVAIRLLGVEKQFGSLKFLLQVCPRIVVPLLVKALIVMVAFLASLIPALSALAIWHHLGGFLDLPEIAVLLLGHLLFALLITSIAFFAVAVTDSPQTAAIVTLAFTITSWVLEFAGQNQTTISFLSWLSMTAHLRLFERGLFSLQATLGFLIASLFFLSLAALWLKTSDELLKKVQKSLIVVIITACAAQAATYAFYYKDFSENRVNSFSPQNEAELRKLTKPLKITINLNPDDSLSVDFERNFLSKLRRVVKDLTVVYTIPKEKTESGQGDPNFGQITYDYNNVRMLSHDVGAPRALEVLHMMTGALLVGKVASPYAGHPLRADAGQYRLWFYGILPSLVLMIWMLSQKFLRKKYGVVVNASIEKNS